MTIDLQTFELGKARVRLRSDLRFTLHRSSSARWYVVEDDSRGQFFRIGLAEYAFLSLLDGRRTLDEAQAELASIPRCFAIDEYQAAGIVKWVIDSGLAESHASRNEGKLTRALEQSQWQTLKAWMNPISWRLPLFNPDKMLGALSRKTRRLPGWLLSVLWCAVLLTAFLMMLPRWTEFWQHRVTAFSSWDALWLAAAWLVMKLLHETAHGLVCKSFGGRVPTVGVVLLLFIPLPYIDVTSSWRFPRRRQRILTAAAGMLAEMFVAACAGIVWCRVEPGPVQYHAGNLILAGTLNTLLFNLNPLMRFDGYHILTDFLAMPNLFAHGRNAVRSLFKSWFFGTRFEPPADPVWSRRSFILGYGLAALGWQILVCLGLSVTAANLFPGLGLILALSAVVTWTGPPIVRLIRYVSDPLNPELPDRRRFAMVTGMLVLCVSLGMLAPAPGTIRAPLVVLQDLHTVRVKSGGRVIAFHVRPGQEVKSGDLLVTLENVELLRDLEQIRIDLRSAESEAARYLADGDIELWQLAKEHAKGLLRRQHELQVLVEDLQIRSDVCGKVLMKDESSLPGQFVRTGELLCSILQSPECRGIALVDQSDARWLREQPDTQMSAVISGHGGSRVPCRLKAVHPRASFDLPHAAFASNLGGPIAVLERREMESGRDLRADSLLASSSTQSAESFPAGAETTRAGSEILRQSASGRAAQSLEEFARSVRMVRPHVQVEVVLTPQTGTGLLVEGQPGILLACSRRTTMARYLAECSGRWIRQQFTINHGL